tara:strand:- start:24717 stop:25736 length:1020 start_codon:yes stop_codon:yes gene_type:complete
MNLNLQKYSHKRFNILTGEWVIVSPHRSKRPWKGQKEVVFEEKKHSYDSTCYLCANNIRINKEVNPDYKDVFVFINDFGALQKDSKSFEFNQGLLKAQSEQGICKVICFSPDHSKSLAELDVLQIKKIIEVWKHEYIDLGKNQVINYVQIFENKGAVMGCSNSHPHGQIWSQSTIPNEVLKKDHQQATYFKKNKQSLLQNYLSQELILKERVVFENENFVILIPFWAIWPFETMIIPKKVQKNISEMSLIEEKTFAEAISLITKAYNRLFNCYFPYSSGIHQSPTDGKNNNHWHWHMSFYPPLLRSSTVKKFMVGYEMFGSPQRDITAEVAANRLRELI